MQKKKTFCKHSYKISAKITKHYKRTDNINNAGISTNYIPVETLHFQELAELDQPELVLLQW